MTTRQLAGVFGALADPTRIEILKLLAVEGNEELYVGEICEEIGMSQPAMSHHLSILKQWKLADYRRQGKFNHYHITALGRQLLKTMQDVVHAANEK